MMARNKPIESDDVLYALTLWKYYAVYFIVRISVRTEPEVRRCLALAMGAAAVVGVVAIMQSLDAPGVAHLLSRLYESDPTAREGSGARGSSTLASSIAVADVMVYCLCIALAWLIRGGRRRGLLRAAAVLYVFGLVSAGQFSGILGLLAGMTAVGILTGQLRRMGILLLCSTPLAAVALWPVVERRLKGFESPEGIPPSWQGRLENLQTFFWPELFSDNNVFFGVRPSARIKATENWRDYIWIESGHTWLLWNGGILFFLAFFLFLLVALRSTARVVRERVDAVGVAGIASCASLVVLAVLMTLDVHLTLRGSADLLFSLLALACGSAAGRPAGDAAMNGQAPSTVRRYADA
jgi:hypothetical protein